jgi:hypothetical protein
VKKQFLIIILAFELGGCATLTKPGGPFYRSEQEKKLAKAVKFQEQGKISAATELLTALTAEPGVAGVTDEALFRLSLIHLVAGLEKNGVLLAQHDLARLRREYPTSSWTPPAANLAEYMVATDDVRQQNRKLKELNSSLTKENKDLSQSIEKLKTLELELGRGNKR